MGGRDGRAGGGPVMVVPQCEEGYRKVLSASLNEARLTMKYLLCSGILISSFATELIRERNVLHPATGDPGDQVDAHTARAPAPHHLIEEGNNNDDF